jgi:hypothetical protein
MAIAKGKRTHPSERRKRKPKPEEPRFYVIVPEKVTSYTHHTVEMEPGRLIAQAFHLGRKFEAEKNGLPYEEITCIVLGARNSRELDLVQERLIDYRSGIFTHGHEFTVHEFKDTNQPLYKSRKKVKTIVCTSPVFKDDVDGAIGHLELYSGRL